MAIIKKIATKILGKIGYSLQKTGNTRFISNWLSDVPGLKINSKKYFFLHYSTDLLKALKKEGCTFYFKNDTLTIQINQLYFQINNWEELFILNEIFVKGVYNVSFEENFALLDIGMNVGIASLYFAGKRNCEIVFAYEPFARTVELAKLNMQLNECSKKIHVYDFGLGYPQRTIAVPYSEESKGSAGILGISGLSADQEKKILKDLQIRDVAAYVSENLKQYTGTYVAKIDCEGAEYEIIERLAESGLLKKIKIYMIEWHVKGPEVLQSIFISNGYYVFCQSHNDGTGLIYAVQKN